MSVATRSHGPGRREGIAQNGVDTMNLDGLPGHTPDRHEAIRGGCGENVLFSTLHRMTREFVLSHSGRDVIEPLRFTPRHMISRAHLGAISALFPIIARTRVLA
jgi:hypothetical protein